MSKYAEDLQYEKYEIEEKKKLEPVNNYKILPLKNLKKEEVGEEDFDILPNVPFLAYCIGAVKSGKSLFMANLFFNPNFPYKNTFDVKILISNTAYNDKIMKPIIEQFDFVFTDYNDALLEEIISMVETDDSDCKYLLVLEDIIGNVNVKRMGGSIDALTGLTTKYRHIGNEDKEGKLSIFIISQYFKYLNSIQRLNASAYFLMGNSPEVELKKMSQEMSVFGGSEKEFVNIYNQSKQEPFDFCFLNIQDLTARRNFEENPIWSAHEKKSGEEKKERENKDVEDENEIPELQTIDGKKY
mgnify:FL=1|tara:strand:- start:12172 stop:13068 length:897 start_codon:yes stop_codon:yes gene_type:complete